MSKFFNVYIGLIRISRFLINSRFYSAKICTDYYEILNLSKNCTPKEIKDAYIRLSKQYHPDTAKNIGSHKMFLQIGEAYKVLSKPELRRSYDMGLHVDESYYNSTGKNPWKDPLFYANRNKKQDEYYRGQPYYGIKGVDRLPNSTVVTICLLMAAVGVGLQILAVRNSFTLNRDRIVAISNETETQLAESREIAERNGNKVQIELFKQRMKDNGYVGFTDDEVEKGVTSDS